MSAGYMFADQCALFGEPRCVGFGDAEFFVREIGRDIANGLIVKNHYSRKFYAASYIHLGVYISDILCGVLQLGYAMNPASQASVVEGTAIDEYLELNRMWLADSAPKNSESKSISCAMKFIRKAHPKIKWVQSFADERCGLFGTVYQACNFHYCGEHEAVFWELDGVVYHNSLMTRDPSLSKSAAILQEGKGRAIPSKLRQFRYIYFMRPRFKKGLLLDVFPYPKPDYAASLFDDPVPAGASRECTPVAAPKEAV